ncbi:cobalamin-dependent protein [Streptomyces sp. NPDC059378]|uniref:cobalamin-dependent protein n=1 Tax=Streptomyces sp. NPDC059378 TaxID=3346815 RepID=UPI00369325DF
MGAGARAAGKPFPGPAASPAGSAPGTAEARRRLRGLARAAARMNAEAVHEQVTDAIKSYGLVPSWEEVLSPALRAAGRKWKSSEDQYVEIEHFLSWQISTALRHAYADFTLQRRPADTRPALLACLPGEQHTLPLEALAAALAERGQRVLMLGSSVPTEAIEATVLRINPACVALWSQTRTTADVPLARHIAAARWGINGARIRSRVLVCGPGWGLRTEPELVRPHGLGDAVRTIGSASRLDADAVPSPEQSHQHSN